MTKITTDKKTYLKQLMKESASFKSLPENAKIEYARIILSGTPEETDKFIKILEGEKAAMQKIDNDFLKQAGEIEHLVAEAKQLEAHATKEIHNEKEEKITIEEEKTANALLKELERMKND